MKVVFLSLIGKRNKPTFACWSFEELNVAQWSMIDLWIARSSKISVKSLFARFDSDSSDVTGVTDLLPDNNPKICSIIEIAFSRNQNVRSKISISNISFISTYIIVLAYKMMFSSCFQQNLLKLTLFRLGRGEGRKVPAPISTFENSLDI